MKKINIYFILECMIIILLLAILGVLLRYSGKSSAKEITLEETYEYEMEEDYSLEEESANVSGIVNVTDVVMGSEEETSHQTIVSSRTGEAGVVSENSISENQDDIRAVEQANTTEKSLSEKKIVVFGDSICNDGRGVDGVSEHIQEITGATVYNCAVGGTSAALLEDNNIGDWTSPCFNGLVYIARGIVPANKVLSGRDACDVIKQVNLEEIDYVIVSYGLNDFFSGVSIHPKEYFEITNYVGALRNGIAKLTENYPNLEVIVVSPTYTKLFEGEREFAIGDYVEAARSVASEYNVHFIDMFHTLGSDEETRLSHLRDGVHLTPEGREVYADAVIRYLESIQDGGNEIE